MSGLRGRLGPCRRWATAALSALSALGLQACQLVFPTVLEGSDAAPSDATPGDAHDDSKPSPEAGSPAAFTAPSSWSVYSVGVNPPNFNGGAFDGRYVYLAPSGGAVTRYDTRGSFTASKSWSSYDPTIGSDAGANFFRGATFDGHDVYFIPDSTNGNVVYRYRPAGKFDSPASWEQFDISKAFPSSEAFAGATFDERYLYLAPTVDGVTARYDTKAPFTSVASWDTVDLEVLDSRAVGFSGGLFDGRYVYFVPDLNFKLIGGVTQDIASGVIVRYDTHGPYALSSWSAFDLTTLNKNAGGFLGGAFDGRYIYLAPFSSSLGTVARFDTKTATALGDHGAWSFFQVNTVNPSADGFFGASFDGRYVYFVPNNNSSPDGVVARFDTTGTFGDKKAWSTFDQTQVNSSALDFWGAVFDGQYVYFVPASTGVVTRFEARGSPRMPKLPGFFGSFY